ncbi:MAG TPA: hypothetical protein PKY46_05625 [Ignavibacteriaceae bacterium]|nr:hypothetical protein [Ignavibacteriaceae bacterium]
MQYVKHFFIPIILILFFAGCEKESVVSPQPEKSLAELYKSAIIDAMVADSGEIVTTLTPVTPSNNKLSWKGTPPDQFVLVLIYTKYPNSYPVEDTVVTWWDATWVTLCPELRDWHKDNGTTENNFILRTEQLLGLPPAGGNEWMVEVWVKPQQLIRPAYDNEITDNTSGLFFPDSVSQEYVNWFNGNIVYSYFPAKNKNGYPWTRLGYTYDWGNAKSEVGLSEYLIKKNSSVIVKSVQRISDYLKAGN